eukprot:g4330.t1
MLRSRKAMLHLPVSVIAEIREKMPSTHEIGGHLLAHEDGIVHSYRVYKGKPCRDENGKRFKNTQCKIQKPDHALSFHTHPKSDRPSSADLRNAVLKHPALGRGKRRMSVIFAPSGIWHYAPTAALLREWRGRRPSDPLILKRMRQWSLAGRRMVDRDRRFADYARLMRRHGLDLRFQPYSKVLAGGGLRLRWPRQAG